MPRHKDTEITEVETVEVDETAALLQAAAAQMMKAASDRENRASVLKDVEGTLSKIKLVDAQALAESPVVQAFLKAMGMDDLRPGETRNKGTLAERSRDWTLEDINKEIRDGRMPLKRFVPNETLPLTFNGVQIYVRANEECEVPECFYNIYREHMEAKRQGALNESYLLGQSDRTPHPNWMTVESARVRAWSMRGPRGQSSGTLTTGRVITSGEEKGA